MCPSVPLVYQVARACILVYPSLATLLHTASLKPGLLLLSALGQSRTRYDTYWFCKVGVAFSRATL